MGLFSKKKELQKPDLPAEYIQLVEKWDVFLQKINTRFEESLQHAEEALLENLDESDYDLTPTEQAWQGIKAQLRGLADKTEETFDEKVLPQMLRYVDAGTVIDERIKGNELRSSIYHRIEAFEIEIEGKIARKFYDHAIQGLNEKFQCTQCGAQLQVRQDIFHAHYVSCDYCNTVNTFTPNDNIRAIRWIVDSIAKHKAFDEWKAKEQARKNIYATFDRYGNNPEKLKEAYRKLEQAERNFWTKYFSIRSEYLSQYKESIEPDTDNKMKWFYEERKRELGY